MIEKSKERKFTLSQVRPRKPKNLNMALAKIGAIPYTGFTVSETLRKFYLLPNIQSTGDKK